MSRLSDPPESASDARPESLVGVTHDPEHLRYVVTVDGCTVGHTAYRAAGAVRTFVHTEVDPAYEGRGLGSRLIGFALADSVAAGVTVRAVCPFVRAYLERHPDALERP